MTDARDTENIRSGWNAIPEELKHKYGSDLPASELIYRRGREDELIERIHNRTGRSVEEIRRDFDLYGGKSSAGGMTNRPDNRTPRY